MDTARQRLGKYELYERLGRGGTAEVWKALDTNLQRYVAIKLLLADLQADPDFVMRFMREAQFIANLRHHNIVQIHDFQVVTTSTNSPADTHSMAYMVMDYVDGQTLGDYIHSTSRKGNYPSASDIIYLFAAVSSAIDYAHQKGVIHRDIKPSNILLDQRLPTGRSLGEPILTDFGIARLQGAQTHTLQGALLGTPLYISPEQALGQNSDERSDLYSLGIILYEIATGITPFRGENVSAILIQHIQAVSTPPALLNPNIPPDLSEVILHSIAKDPNDRFPSASAMTMALANALHVTLPHNLAQPSETPSFYSKIEERQTVASSPISSIALAHTQIPPRENISPGNENRTSNTPQMSVPGTGIGTTTEAIPEKRPASQKRRRNPLVLVVVSVVLLLSIGLGGLLYFTHQTTTTTPALTPTTSNAVVGTVSFVSSQAGNFDQLHLVLHAIPQPQDGSAYYLWLDRGGNEQQAPLNWQLSVSANGSVDYLTPSAPAHTNLLSVSKRILITAETVNNPIIPNPDLTLHFYYASITQSGSATFDVMQCPSNTSNSTANPCL